MEWYHILLIALGSAAALFLIVITLALCRAASIADDAGGE